MKKVRADPNTGLQVYCSVSAAADCKSFLASSSFQFLYLHEEFSGVTLHSVTSCKVVRIDSRLGYINFFE